MFTGRRELYPYTSHLLTLESRRPNRGGAEVPEQWCKIRMPLQLSEWVSQLHQHPDKDFQMYLKEGFRIGFKYGTGLCQGARGNMNLATDKPAVVMEYLEKERLMGQLIGTLKREEWPGMHVKPIWSHTEGPPTGQVKANSRSLPPQRR